MTCGADVRGFTLVETVATLVVTAILASMVMVFLRGSVEGYADSARRAELAYLAETALRHMERDMHGALPNSARVSSVNGVTYLEFLLLRTGGRYRAESDPAWVSSVDSCGTEAESDVLAFGVQDDCFRSLGDLLGAISAVAGADFLVVANSGVGVAGADAYETGPSSGGNKALISAVSASSSGVKVEFEANTFQNASPGKRFYIISGPVSYRCDPVSGRLMRYWNYPIASIQPVTFPVASSALVADHVTACDFSAGNPAALGFTVQLGGESVKLYRKVRVGSQP